MGLELPRANEPDGKDCDPIKVILIRVWGSQDLGWFYPSMINAAHAPWDVSELNMQELLDTRAALTHLHQHVCKTSTHVAFGERKLLASKPKHGSNVDVYLTQGVTEYKRLMVYDLLTKCGAYRDLVEILRRARMNLELTDRSITHMLFTISRPSKMQKLNAPFWATTSNVSPQKTT